MKKSLLCTCAAAALMLFTTGAQAADVTEPASEENVFYVSLFGGASFLGSVDTEQNYEPPSTFSDFDYTLETKTGYILGGAVGMRVWDPLRAEVELSYARWKVDRYSGEEENSDDPFNGDAIGHVSATYLLANLWFDINTETSFTPYVGGGAGVAWVDADTEFGPPTRFGYADGEMGFAFQAGAGVQFPITENIALDVGYRFKGVLDIDFGGRQRPSGNFILDYEGGDLYSHNVQAGVTFSF